MIWVSLVGLPVATGLGSTAASALRSFIMMVTGVAALLVCGIDAVMGNFSNQGTTAGR